MGKDTSSTLLILSTAMVLALLASPLVISNFLLQPAQAQTSMTFKTPTPAYGGVDCPRPGGNYPGSITFDAHGSTTDSGGGRITDGTYQITSNNGRILVSGNIPYGNFVNSSIGGSISMTANVEHALNSSTFCVLTGHTFQIRTDCKTFNTNSITTGEEEDFGEFSGAVECSSSSQGGGGNTASSSMNGTTTTQDSDGDGIPDSSDRCTHNSNQGCYKESK